MSKKRTIYLIIACVIAAWLFDVLIGRSLTAKLSTMPVLNRLKILSPQAPIVITNRETVRVSDSTDIVQAASQIKSKLSSVVLVNSTSAEWAGTAVNLSSDGSFITAAGTFGSKAGSYYILLNDGREAQITKTFPDPATSLVFFKADIQNVPVAPIGSSAGLAVAEKIILAQSSLQNFSVKTENLYIDATQAEIADTVFESDLPRRAFTAFLPSALSSGEAFVNTNAEIVGINNGNAIISSDVLKKAMALYFSQNGILRPAFGFSYSYVTENESKLTGTPSGDLVKGVAAASAAHTAGLLPGDLIISVDGQNITESPSLEEILQNYKPGDRISLIVFRKSQTVNLVLTAAQLK